MEQASIAVVGIGDWGKNLVRNFHKLSKLIAICDINHIVAEQIAVKYQVKNLSWQQILDSNEINTVAIVKDQSHYQFVKEALLANKHVFVEKPLAHTFKQAKELCNIASQVNKKIMVGHLLQYHPAFVELQKLCKEQALGKLRYVYSNRLSFGKVMAAEDVLWNYVPHDISMILTLMGKPKSINSYANYFLTKNIADQITIQLNFSNEQKGHIFASWLHPIKERKFVVIGSKSMAVFDDTLELCQKLCLYPYAVDLDATNKPVLKNLQPEFINLKNTEEPLFQETSHFVKCIEQDLTPLTDGVEALAVLQIIEQASKQLQVKQKACAD
ncbi:MAG: Gfo/Idh/MocA family oxidoreductase [Gammaproteobacteria bacterium]